MTITLNEITFELLYEKALYEPEQQLLIIADVHLGKALHFRKQGIAIPAAAQNGDYKALQELFDKIKPKQVYFLGDLFHSAFNNDWHTFCDLINDFKHIKFILVKGNHDLIDTKLFSEMCITVVDTIEEEGLVYSHEPLKKIPAGKINICGHIHPGIVLSGAGRQSVKLPCFYLLENLFVLPAFGVLTGLYPMSKEKGIKVYGVLPGLVKRVF